MEDKTSVVVPLRGIQKALPLASRRNRASVIESFYSR
jgi:hypothetical protein